jgi:pyruvate kinase
MAIEWGLYPILFPECADVEELWATAIQAALDAGLAGPGDRLVITAGTTVNVPGSTNVIKVETL